MAIDESLEVAVDLSISSRDVLDEDGTVEDNDEVDDDVLLEEDAVNGNVVVDGGWMEEDELGGVDSIEVVPVEGCELVDDSSGTVAVLVDDGAVADVLSVREVVLPEDDISSKGVSDSTTDDESKFKMLVDSAERGVIADVFAA